MMDETKSHLSHFIYIYLYIYIHYHWLNASHDAVTIDQAGDVSSAVRLYVFLGDMGTAESLVAETSDPAATFQLGQQVTLEIHEKEHEFLSK
jgi:hypothetical protein